MRRLLSLVAIIGVLVAVTGCGSIRLDTPDDPPSTPNPGEVARQQLAVQSAALSATASHAASAAETATANLLMQIAADADAQTLALGGVWHPRSRHLSQPLVRGDATLVLTLLFDGATDAREASLQQQGSSQLLAGIAASRTLRSMQLAALVGTEPVTIAADMPQVVAAESAAELIRTLDALGWVWEVVAARSSGEARDAATATADRWRDQADALAHSAAVAGTDDDPREPSYAVDTSDTTATIAALTADLVPGWLAQITATSGDDRSRVIDQAIVAAQAAGLTTADATVPPVLGVE